MNKYLSLCEYTDYMIYNELDDGSLFNLAMTCKKYCGICTSEKYFKYRISKFYGMGAIDNKPFNITYKQYYIDIISLLYYTGFNSNNIHRIDLMLIVDNLYNFSPNKEFITEVIKSGNVEVFNFVCKKCNCDEEDFMNHRFLSQCIMRNNLNMLIYISDKYGIDVNSFRRNPIESHFNIDTSIDMLKYLSNYLKVDVNLLERALSNGNVPMVEWIMDRCNVKPRHLSLECAMQGGNIYLIKKLLKFFRPNQRTFELAIVNSNLEIVTEIMNKHFKINIQSLNNAFINNKLDILRYVWNTYNLKPDSLSTVLINNFDCIKWYSETFPEINNWKACATGACTYKHLNILQYLYDNYKCLPERDKIINMMSYSNPSVEIISWLYENNLIYNFEPYISNIKDLKVLKFIYNKTFLIPDFRIDQLNQRGFFHITNWLSKLKLNNIYI